METGAVITLVIGGLAAAVLIAIGVAQILSRKPVAFYTGEEPPAEHMVRNLHAWNTGHGLLWISYGVIIMVCFTLGILVISDALARTLVMFCGAILPIFLMMAGHHILVKRLLGQNGE